MMSRSFRIQVYNTFRDQRDEYNHRKRVGRDVLRSYALAGHDPKHRSLAIDWYRHAIIASRFPGASDLPAQPVFVTAAATSDPVDSDNWNVETAKPEQATETTPIEQSYELGIYDEKSPGSEHNEEAQSESFAEPTYPVLRSMGRAVMSAVRSMEEETEDPVDQDSEDFDLGLEPTEEATEQTLTDLVDEENEFTTSDHVIDYVEPPRDPVESR